MEIGGLLYNQALFTSQCLCVNNSEWTVQKHFTFIFGHSNNGCDSPSFTGDDDLTFPRVDIYVEA